MVSFRKREREVPGLNTAALPDLIFTVLFFFMIVTHMRQADLKVQYKVPQGTELDRLTHKQTAQYLYIGPASKELQPTLGTGTLIQLNDRIVTIDELRDLLIVQRQQMSDEDCEQMVVSIRADKNTDMGIIADVKQALREANALRISYAAVSKEETNN
jgi:biopolymer transport protein ExbD